MSIVGFDAPDFCTVSCRPTNVAVCKAMLQTGIYPNFIVVEDGIGAAPLEFIDHLACPCGKG
jgi:hypothetical protein